MNINNQLVKTSLIEIVNDGVKQNWIMKFQEYGSILDCFQGTISLSRTTVP